jgi:glutaryl-CoA dehydrogenase (non-decarboxylating)
VAGFALTEPDAGTDAASLRTRAERVPGGYRITGAKAWIGLADVADQFLVFATLDRERKHAGISAFLVRREAEGLRSESIRGKHGIRAGNVGRLFFDRVFVPEEDRLGEEGEGFHVAMSALDNGRFGVAAGSLGIIEACLEACVERCRARGSFGREIGRHQLVQQMLARMAAARDVGRLLVDSVADMKCRGVRHTREASLAKWINCDAAHRCASDALQVFGAHGYSNEFAIERHLRNCRAALIYEGTREIHQVIQAEYLLGYREDRPLRRSLPPYPFPEDG